MVSGLLRVRHRLYATTRKLKKMKEYQRCTRCIMDNASDETITFNEKGECNYCTEALAKIGTTTYFPDAVGEAKIKEMVSLLKREGQGKEYDCLMGISGGLDSSYLAYLGYKWGLRILAVHIDDGYDTEISKANIKKLCEAAHIELKTIKPDAKQFNELTLAYMKAGVPNLAIPQDNILLAFLYDVVRDTDVKYFLSGGNFALECILQQGNTFSSMDTVNIKDIFKRFGRGKIDKLRFISSYRKFWYKKTGKIVEFRPLNYINYNRDQAFKELGDFCGFEYYGRKHLENILTAFIQLYWLPQKFNADKRSSHLSSMIVSGQMTRDEALKELAEPMYNEQQMKDYIQIIKSRMGMSDKDFDTIMAAPAHQHNEYKTDKLSVILRKIIG